MAENVAKIVLDASVDGVLRAAEAVKKKFSEVGSEGGKAADNLVKGLGKSLITAGALVAAVRGVAEALNTAAANAAKIAKESGGNRLNAELAGQRLGLNAGQTSSVLSATGPRTAQERESFLTSLAGAKGPGGRTVDSGTALEASRLFGTGVIGQDEILSAISTRGRRGLSDLSRSSGQRLSGLSDEARGELSAREAEQAAALRVSDTAGEAGQRERLRVANREALRAENPTAFAVQDAIGSATNKVGGPQLIEAGERWLSGIYQNTKPRLNTSSNGP